MKIPSRDYDTRIKYPEVQPNCHSDKLGYKLLNDTTNPHQSLARMANFHYFCAGIITQPLLSKRLDLIGFYLQNQIITKKYKT
jgi:hypothetical protein